MSSPGYMQRNRVLRLAAMVAGLFLLAMSTEATAQGQCPAGYRPTPQGCFFVNCGQNMVYQNGRCVPNAAALRQQQQQRLQQQRAAEQAKQRAQQQRLQQQQAQQRAAQQQAQKLAQPCPGAYQVRNQSGQCVCAQNYVLQGGACVSKQAGTKKPGSSLVTSPCGQNQIYANGKCIPDPKGPGAGSAEACGPAKTAPGTCQCREGYKPQGGKCVQVVVCRDPYSEPYEGTCRCKTGYRPGQGGRCLQVVVCKGAYEVERNGRCECQAGYKRNRSNICAIEVVYCTGPYEVKRGDRCDCADGYIRRDGTCVRRGQQVVVVPPLPLPPPAPGFVSPPPPTPAAPPPAPPPAPAPQYSGPDFEPGQILVGFRSPGDVDDAVRDLNEAQRAGGITARGAQSSSIQADRVGPNALKISIDFRSRSGERLGRTEELAALRDYGRRLAQRSDVSFAHPNWVMELQAPRVLRLEDLSSAARVQTTSNAPSAANDPAPRNDLLWHYRAPPTGMNAFAAWSQAKGSRDVVVAVIDTGILPNHPDIKGSGNVLAGYNFISSAARKGNNVEGPEPNSTDFGDECPEKRLFQATWHGTHVAGTVGAASPNNDQGITGVNWSVSVLPIRTMGRCGGSIADIASAINWAAGVPVPGVPQNERRADIINLSLGLRGMTCQREQIGFLIDALDAARKAGVVVVVAAGNHRIDIKDMAPAACPGVISVAASDLRGHLTPYSNYGNVTLMAPGGDLDRDDDNDNRPDGVWSLVAPSDKYPSGVAAMEGTSMAAPHVSASIALLLSVRPELRGKPDEIEKLLKRSLAPKPANACSRPCGGGLLDVKALIQPEVAASTTRSTKSPR
jgi:subtilisin family serine protease